MKPVLILDFGSQYTQLIARRVRELGFYSEIIRGDAGLDVVKGKAPIAIVLSGGPNSVFDPKAPRTAEGFWSWQESTRLPVLGICYGLQLMVHDLGGKVESAPSREYGRMRLKFDMDSDFLSRAYMGESPVVWMSHGDETREVPRGFRVLAKSESGSVAALENAARKLYALQFHPEVTHTEHGREILEAFLRRSAELSPNWSMGSVAEETIEKIRAQIGPNAHALCALSGGVDSTVAAALVHKAIGDRLHCVFVDHGLLRFKERERVMAAFERELHLPVTCVDASQRFLGKLAGVEDPEVKRKIIGAEFIGVFDDFAKNWAAKLGKPVDFLVQGTLYPDVIESSGTIGMAVTIKSHHNVGGLPKDIKFKLCEPLRELFKDEVRRIGKVVGVPDSFLQRHPFPGPGLAVRILGEITPERVAILQRVDEIYIQALHELGLYHQIWQAFAVFLPIRSVGVQGDGRTHDHVVGLRAVTSSDGMTAEAFEFPAGFLREVSTRICNQVKGVSRVVYDVTSKPPATIEWE